MVVTVIEASGPLARLTGPRMLVSEGQRVGSIGGGHLELQAICEAESLLGRTGVEGRQVRYALGTRPDDALTLGYARLDAPQLATWPEPSSLFHLQLHGGGALGAALVRVLATIDCSVDWIVTREEHHSRPAWDANSRLPERVRALVCDAVESRVADALAGTYYLVLAHGRELELRLAETILRRGDFGYFGLVGTRTKRMRYARRLEQCGIPPDRLERMACPAGIDGISGRQPESLAVAVVAQLLQRCGA